MKQETEISIADSLEVDSILLPYMPYLLKDLWALGSSVEQIVDLIERLKFNCESVKVLDLGCGKGAVSIQIASKYGFYATGIDAMEKFIANAKRKAIDYAVSHQCEFLKQDIVDYTKSKHNFDIVILASLGGIFGNNSETMKILRNQIITGGYIIIDDGYLRNKESLVRKGYEHYRSYDTTKEELTFLGDKIIMEISTNEQNININEEYLTVISRRCNELKKKHPEICNAFKNYLELQKEECKIIESEVEGRIWVLQKCK